jgi:hypothetical protein
MADSRDELAVIQDTANVVARLDLIFNDTSEEFLGVRPPNAGGARAILAFVNANRHVPHLIFQCQVGVGRSAAALAALAKLSGTDNREILGHGTYNRRLCKELLKAAGVALEPEPLVSLAVRIKYAPDRLQQVRWPGHDFTSDRDYLLSLMAVAKDRVATLPRPLFIHN